MSRLPTIVTRNCIRAYVCVGMTADMPAFIADITYYVLLYHARKKKWKNYSSAKKNSPYTGEKTRDELGTLDYLTRHTHLEIIRWIIIIA